MKFTIVTPTFNSQAHLTETIESVLSQNGDFEIEYIIMDGGSNDQTNLIAQEYARRISQGEYPIQCRSISMKTFSGKDKGMYDAIHKGFEKGTGDVFAWINSDDFYLPGAFESVRKSFVAFPEIKWVKGITSFVTQNGTMYEKGRCFLYNQDWIARGIYGRNAYFIHQDSVFWRKSLWDASGGLPVDLKYAGDYALWINFAKHAPLWSLDYPVSCFRKRPGQLSGDMTNYRKEQKTISVQKGFLNWKVKVFFWLQSKRPQWLHPLFLFLYRLAFKNRNTYFIAIDSFGKPIRKKTNLYAITHA